MGFCAIIVAAGTGTRAGPGGAKQWRRLSGKPVARWSAEGLLAAGAGRLCVVIAEGDEALAADALAGLPGWTTAPGGATRAGSVVSGLEGLAADEGEVVLVHDAARPFVGRAVVERLLAALDGADGAVPALAVADTLKRLDEANGGALTVARAGLWRAQTPQAFSYGTLVRAYGAWVGD